jgi:hypothetical protein
MQLVKGSYIVHLPDGRVIPLTFNTWVFRNYANSKGQTLDEFHNRLNGGNFSTDDVIDLMLWGSKYAHAKTNSGAHFPFTDMDACEWFDALGGMTGEKAMQLMLVIVGTMANKDPSDIQDKVSQQKKSEE